MKMKSLFVSSFITLVIIVSLVTIVKCQDDIKMARKHDHWMAKHGRVYKDHAEKSQRFDIFKRNIEFIKNFNSNPNNTFRLRPNVFADITNDEFKQRISTKPIGSTQARLDNNNGPVSSTCHRSNDNNNNNNNNDNNNNNNNNTSTVPANTPASVDWRQKGAVSPVKNQGSCSVCWALASSAAVESLMFLKTGKLPSVSVDQLVDCVYANIGRSGCYTGRAEDAYKFYIDNKGFATDNTYHNLNRNLNVLCNSKDENTLIRGYSQVRPRNDEVVLMAAIANQPMSAELTAGSQEFQFYAGGVFTGSCGERVNHMVTLVGYGTTQQGQDYWLAKNSWGTNWGEDGYFRLLRNSDILGGQCQIASSVTYPY